MPPIGPTMCPKKARVRSLLEGALDRAGRLYGEPAQEVLSTFAGARGAAALWLHHQMYRCGQGCGWQRDRSALHLRSSHAQQQRSRWAQRWKAQSTGFRQPKHCPAKFVSMIGCSRLPCPKRTKNIPSSTLSTAIRCNCCPMPLSSRALPQTARIPAINSSVRAISGKIQSILRRGDWSLIAL